MTGPIKDVESAVRELGALPMPIGPGPVVRPLALHEAQIDALAASGNRAVNDAVHQDLCACDAWPEKCLSSGGYFQGYWDMGGMETAIPAVLGLWESMRGAELEQLRTQIAELQAERHTTNEALSDAAETLRENQHRIGELERPAVERHRREIRESYRWLAAHARADGDFEGEAVVMQQLAEREALWVQEDKLAREFATDPLAVKPWTPGPSAEASADKLTRLFAPTQALREDPHDSPLHHTYRVPRELPQTGGA